LLPRRIAVDQLRATYRQHQPSIVAQGDSCKLSFGHGMRDAGELVPSWIAREPKGRDMAAGRRLEPHLRFEHQLSHLRVQPVGADDEVEPLLASVGQGGSLIDALTSNDLGW